MEDNDVIIQHFAAHPEITPQQLYDYGTAHGRKMNIFPSQGTLLAQLLAVSKLLDDLYKYPKVRFYFYRETYDSSRWATGNINSRPAVSSLYNDLDLGKLIKYFDLGRSDIRSFYHLNLMVWETPDSKIIKTKNN